MECRKVFPPTVQASNDAADQPTVPYLHIFSRQSLRCVFAHWLMWKAFGFLLRVLVKVVLFLICSQQKRNVHEPYESSTICITSVCEKVSIMAQPTSMLIGWV
jgi:hypothetical protein